MRRLAALLFLLTAGAAAFAGRRSVEAAGDDQRGQAELAQLGVQIEASRTAWKIHKAIPDSELVIFERSGHLPWYEEPARFLSVMEGFLGK